MISDSGPSLNLGHVITPSAPDAIRSGAWSTSEPHHDAVRNTNLGCHSKGDEIDVSGCADARAERTLETGV